MTREQFKEYVCKQIDMMSDEEIVSLADPLLEESQEERVAEELIVIKGEFKKLTKLLHSMAEEMKTTETAASKERLKPFIDLYIFVKNSKDALASMPENTLFSRGKFNRAFGAFENGFHTIDMLYRDIMQSADIQLVAKEGDLFDADWHEAVDVTEDSELEDGEIVEVLEDGFSYRDELINYAKVKVNRWI